MGWFTIVIWVIRNAPTLISLVKQFLSIIDKKPVSEQLAAKAELKDAIKSGDAKLLAGLLHKHCEGVACEVAPPVA